MTTSFPYNTTFVQVEHTNYENLMTCWNAWKPEANISDQTFIKVSDVTWNFVFELQLQDYVSVHLIKQLSSL